MAKEPKKRIALYYYRNGADAKDEALRLRGKGHSVHLLDAEAFLDKESVDEVLFLDAVPDELREKIESSYLNVPSAGAAEDVENDDDSEVEIPENWDDLSFPELQKIASAISGSAVRSKAAAVEVIEEELDRREKNEEE